MAWPGGKPSKKGSSPVEERKFVQVSDQEDGAAEQNADTDSSLVVRVTNEVISRELEDSSPACNVV